MSIKYDADNPERYLQIATCDSFPPGEKVTLPDGRIAKGHIGMYLEAIRLEPTNLDHYRTLALRMRNRDAKTVEGGVSLIFR